MLLLECAIQSVKSRQNLSENISNGFIYWIVRKIRSVSFLTKIKMFFLEILTITSHMLDKKALASDSLTSQIGSFDVLILIFKIES